MKNRILHFKYDVEINITFDNMFIKIKAKNNDKLYVYYEYQNNKEIYKYGDDFNNEKFKKEKKEILNILNMYIN
jgi:uncharacterized ion transporter superfamily protein YfcC